MRESEEKLEATSDQKSRIRERYKGIDEDQLDVIPAIPTEDFYKPNSIKRVAVYARVSTDDPRQTSSYELQKNHYTDLVNRREDWKLVDIYADEGISGTSLKHRDSFIRMIADCKAGKIDLIVTKSVSRFARNVLDCIGYVRQLAAMSPPIGVFFETENIYTLNPNSEMSLSFISTLAQEESHNKSEIMNIIGEVRGKNCIILDDMIDTAGTITNAVLQAIGRMSMPIVSAGVSLVIQTAALVLFLRFTDWGIYAMVLVSVLYAAIIFALNELFLRHYLDLRIRAWQVYGMPILSAAVMGAVTWGVYRGVFALASRIRGEYFANFMAVIPAILAAIPVYFFILIRFGGFTEEDILGLPKGTALVRLLKKLRWLA